MMRYVCACVSMERRGRRREGRGREGKKRRSGLLINRHDESEQATATANDNHGNFLNIPIRILSRSAGWHTHAIFIPLQRYTHTHTHTAKRRAIDARLDRRIQRNESLPKDPFPQSQPPPLQDTYRPRLPLLLSKYAPIGLVGVCNGVCSLGGIPILISPIRLKSACSAIRISDPGSRLSSSTLSG